MMFYERLMKEKEQLRKKEEQLRDKELVLLRQRYPVAPATGKYPYNFGSWTPKHAETRPWFGCAEGIFGLLGNRSYVHM